MPFSLRARVVFPVDRPPIDNGFVTIDGDRIVAVGTKVNGGEVTDLGQVALIPGLVNAHTHLEFSYLQRPLGKIGMPFVDWIRLVIAERGRGNLVPLANVNRGLLESYSHGVTTIGDITTGAATSGADVIHFHEVIGFSRARAESALRVVVERIKFQPPSHHLLHGISPHAPYTVSQKLVKALVSQAQEHHLPMAMHIAESRDELELLRDGAGPFRELLEDRSMWDPEAVPLGSRPLDYLQILADAPRSLVIHGNYLDDEELSFLASNRERMSLVYCPRTHAFFIHPPYPLSRAVDAGVRVALGTDSRASNLDLDLLAEMRFVVRSHPATDPQEVLRMGTLNGAEALGRATDVGSITPSKLANLVALEIPGGIAEKNWADVLTTILSANTKPSAVYLAGRPLNP
jgi:cytosine/adenosine deaminase-related metal-dependent hydrolase